MEVGAGEAPPFVRFGLVFLLPVLASAQFCKSGQLSLSKEFGGGGLGHVYSQVVIRNDSKSACYLEGVPRVTLLDDSGTVILSKAEGNVGVNACGEGSNRYLLKPGRSATIWIDTLNAYFEENVCGTRLRLSIQGSTAIVSTMACGQKGEPVGVFLSGFVDVNACGGK